MPAFDTIFAGNAAGSGPQSASAGGATVSNGLDTSTGCEWVNAGHGYKPLSEAFALSNQLSITAEIAPFVVTAPVTGLYRIDGLVVSTTTDAGTLPAVTLTYTDADSASAESVVLLTSTTNSVPGIQKSASVIINVKAGGTITFTGTSYATSTYSAKFRATYLG